MMLLSLLACDTVNVGDGTPFPVLSAFSFPSWTTEGVWVNPSRPLSPSLDDVFGVHNCILTDVTLGCVREQSFQQQYIDASEALLGASEAGHDMEAFCDGAPEFLAALDAASEAFPPLKQSLALNFSVRDGAGGYGGDVPAGAYEFKGDTLDVSGYYYRDRSVERISYADHWDAEACAVDWEAYSTDHAKLDVEGYDIVGTVTIGDGDGQVLSGSWQGTLAGEGDLDGNETSGSFATALCEITAPDRLVFPWY